MKLPDHYITFEPKKHFVVKSIEMEYKTKPTKKKVMADVRSIMKLKKDVITFVPKHIVVHASVWGWSSMWTVIVSTEPVYEENSIICSEPANMRKERVFYTY